MKKRIYSVFLANVLFVMSLSALSPVYAEAAELEPTTVTCMTYNYSLYPDSYDLWIEKCKEEFNITVDLQNVVTENYPATLKTKMSAGDMPDMIMTHGIYPDYSSVDAQFSADMFVDISDLENFNNFDPNVRSAVTIDGKVFYMPIFNTTIGVIYNKQVFADNGIDIPTNIEEFYAVMDALKEKGIAPLAGSFADAVDAQFIPITAMDSFVTAKDPDIGIKVYDSGSNTSSVTYASLGEDAVRAIQLGRDWVEAGYFTEDPAGTGSSAAAQYVANGDAAMYIALDVFYSYVAQASEDPENIGFFPLPLNEPGEKIVMPSKSDEGLCINANGENVEAAKIAMNCYLSDEIQKEICDEISGVSTNLNYVSENSFVNDVVNALRNADLMPKGWLGGGAYWLPRNSTFDLETECQSVICGIKTAEEFLEDLDACIAENVG